jgi:hypothetical protein
LPETCAPGADGAWAALECQYHAFNQRDLTVVRALWSASARLDRPRGGNAVGIERVCAEYAEIFARPDRATLRLTDVTAFVGVDQAVFVGTEVVTYGDRVSRFRATRCFRYERDDGRWRQFHFHGSPA